ncbi:erythromycin esterase family protein [Flavobacterium sp.]|uniref:erythromycin esterase family protein n=1 Tax=Flavobacterium sp. TaxID=239 RepID=UPI0026293F70|nr:erythromycin esterase family protein [Flavobacterium sp.]
MSKKIVYIIINLLFLNVNAQIFNPKTSALAENLTAQDFSFLKEELKNVQVVMLGENTHFDGNVFEVKTEIIKYLHQELGFTTIAFESGVYDIWKAQKYILSGENTKTAFEKSLFPIWSRTKEFQSFIEFFDKNKSKLKVIGFDSQITGDYGERELIKDLYDYCNQNQLAFKLNKEDLELVIESINNSGVFDEGDITYEKYRTALNNLLTNIDKKPTEEIHLVWKQIIKNLLAIGEASYATSEPIVSTFYTTSDDNNRDKQMADNLLAYIKTHPNEKIICWGANAHFVNDVSSIKTVILKDHIPMGSYLKKELNNKIYSLAAVTAADSIYLNNVWSKTPLHKNSFEQFLKDKNKAHLFVSSNQEDMKTTQLNRFFSPIDFVEARLDLLHDGYLFFNQVKQSTVVESEENSQIASIKSTNATARFIDIQKQKIKPAATVLDEIVIINYTKKFTYSIVRKAIENSSKNYPNQSFSSQQHTNIDIKLQNQSITNLDFINNQFDRGYNQSDRNSKQLVAIKWNSQKEYKPTNIRQFRSLTYNNPIMYSSCFNSRKSKKFVYKITEVIKYNNKTIYVINFSIPRNHYTYTSRQITGNYSGTMYINKDDFAIVKIIENWEFMENPETSKYDLYGWNEKFITKEINSETIETNFEKINNHYFLTNSEIEITGKLFDQEKKSYQFKIYIDSSWDNFQIENPIKIAYKEEIELFDKVKYNATFWENYQITK